MCIISCGFTVNQGWVCVDNSVGGCVEEFVGCYLFCVVL